MPDLADRLLRQPPALLLRHADPRLRDLQVLQLHPHHQGLLRRPGRRPPHRRRLIRQFLLSPKSQHYGQFEYTDTEDHDGGVRASRLPQPLHRAEQPAVLRQRSEGVEQQRR